ncbi:hypothetical protein ACFZDG_33870 [Kitasatospora xanthocidica]
MDVRKNVAALTDAEKADFVRAVQADASSLPRDVRFLRVHQAG